MTAIVFVPYLKKKEYRKALCYHVLILYNPATDTLNYTAKSERNRLKYFEYGGRHLVWFYANFDKGNNRMGLEDFTAETDEKMTDSVVRIKKCMTISIQCFRKDLSLWKDMKRLLTVGL